MKTCTLPIPINQAHMTDSCMVNIDSEVMIPSQGYTISIHLSIILIHHSLYNLSNVIMKDENFTPRIIYQSILRPVRDVCDPRSITLIEIGKRFCPLRATKASFSLCTCVGVCVFVCLCVCVCVCVFVCAVTTTTTKFSQSIQYV